MKSTADPDKSLICLRGQVGPETEYKQK